MNIPEANVIPTFLTVAAKEIEPFEPKTLHQAKNDASWLEWERAMLEEVNCQSAPDTAASRSGCIQISVTDV
jgi:hypothetical protein